jgi:hypothetical protein
MHQRHRWRFPPHRKILLEKSGRGNMAAKPKLVEKLVISGSFLPFSGVFQLIFHCGYT